MKRKTVHRYSSWFTLLMAVVVAIAYGASALYMAKLRKNIDDQTQAIAYETSREQTLHATRELLKDVLPETQRLEGFFVAPDGAIDFIELLESFSSVVGAPVTISDVRVENENTVTGEGLLVLSVASSGSWRSQAHLLELLDTLPTESVVDGVTLNFVDSSEENTFWNLKGVLHVPLRNI